MMLNFNSFDRYDDKYVLQFKNFLISTYYNTETDIKAEKFWRFTIYDFNRVLEKRGLEKIKI